MIRRIATVDWCPARITPHPPGVPTDRPLRAFVDDGQLVVMWLERADLCRVRLRADDYQVRQAGRRRTAHPRLLDAGP